MDVFLSISPAYLLHRAVVTTFVETGWVIVHDLAPLSLRYLILADRKVGQANLMDRFLAAAAGVGAHQETAAFNRDKFHFLPGDS